MDEEEIYQSIRDERTRQRLKWGYQHHSLSWWSVILGEEFGEACNAIYEALTTDNPNRHLIYLENEDLKHVEEELIQVAAVATAIIADLKSHPYQSAAEWR